LDIHQQGEGIMANIGYIRVSSVGQHTDRQLAGVTLDKTFEEKASAKDTAGRPQLRACIDYARDGDTVHAHSIDRMARNLGELLGLIETFNAKGVMVRFHKEGLLFTGQDNPMQRLQMQIVGAVAEFERNLIKERQKEGIAAAQAAGKRFGRPAVLTDEKVAEIKRRLAQGEAKTALAREFGVARQTLYAALASA
jgi:DNA invertase Pin-like site-specific DNA recombinase